MNIDEVVLNFSPGTLVILNVVLGLIMLGIALDVAPSDFKVVLRHPRPFIIAILAQLLVLPLVTFGLTLALANWITPSMALGMILVACCPPGNISQVLTHRAGGNVALSVSMTAVGNLIYIVALPLSIAFWGSLHPTARELLREVTLDPWRMLLEIFLIIGLPFIIGLLLRAKFGRALRGIGSNEQRMAAMGYVPYRYKLAIFMVGAALAGLAGFLFIAKNGSASPEMMSWHQSGVVLLMVLIGGIGRLSGAVWGAVIYVLLQELLTSHELLGPLSEHWLLWFGMAIIVIVALLPQGVMGEAERWMKADKEV